jgi:hypothetical protein
MGIQHLDELGKGAMVMIAILEDEDRRIERMREILTRLYPTHQVVFLKTAPDMIAWLGENLTKVVLFSLDYDLGPDRQVDGQVFKPGTGQDVVHVLARHAPVAPVIVHSTNLAAAPGMVTELEGAGWTVHRVQPYDDRAMEWIGEAWKKRVVACLDEKA